MSQLRLNPLTGRWVTIVAERAERPSDFAPRSISVEADPDSAVPVLPRQRRGDDRRRSRRSTRVASWRMRVVPNLYPAFDGDEPFAVHHLGPVHVEAEASGIHEVFVFTPDHDGRHPHAHRRGRRRPDAGAEASLPASTSDTPNIRYTQAIINHGREAGASLAHPARPAARAAVRSGRDPRRAARLQPVRGRLHPVHHDRGRARRRQAGRVRQRRRRVRLPVLERLAVRAADHPAAPRPAPHRHRRRLARRGRRRHPRRDRAPARERSATSRTTSSSTPRRTTTAASSTGTCTSGRSSSPPPGSSAAPACCINIVPPESAAEQLRSVAVHA